MKKIFVLIISVFLTGSLNTFSQSLSNTSISGTFTVGKSLIGHFDSDEDTLTGPSYTYEWFSYNSSGGDELDLSENSTTYLITGSELDRRLKFIVHLTNSYNDFTISDTSSLSPVIVANSTPVANNVTVSVPSNLNVGSTLICSYDYFDADGDLEDNTLFQWRIADTETGSYSNITGATDYTYVIQLADEGKWFIVRVNPDALTGANNSDNYISASAAGPANTAPSITGLSIPSSVSVGDDILASYTFNDPDSGDDDASTFRWFRDGVEFANNSNSYTTTSEDQGSDIYVIVTPVSDSGYPDTGSPETSNVCSVDVNAFPLATELCISGYMEKDRTIYGYYTYEKNGTRNESYSRAIWEVDGIVVKEGLAISSNKRLLLSDSTWLRKDIVFKVVPVAGISNPTVGDTASSAIFTKITNATTSFSITEDPEVLTAIPVIGRFDGNGVSGSGSNWEFDPGDDDVDIGAINVIEHILEVETCTQHAFIDFYVDSSKVYFDSNFRSYFCYEDVSVTIGLEGLGDVEYLAGSGQFILSPNIPGGIISATDTEVTINPRAIGPSNNDVVLQYLYFVQILDPLFGIPIGFVPFIISKPLVIDHIDQNLAISDSPDEYCENGDTLTILSSDKFPSGGSGIWNSPLIFDQNTDRALIDPSLDGSGLKTIYYEYTSPIGCSKQVSKDIYINPAPEPDFTIADGCIEDGTDSTLFVNTTANPLQIAAWQWDFGESFSTISTESDPKYMYRTEGIRYVTLKAETTKGCIDEAIIEIDLGVKPEGDFYWEDDCFDPGVDLKLFDATKPTSTIDSLFWVFNHSTGSDTTFNQVNTSFAKSLPEIINVEYYLLTKYPDCSDTVRKDIYIRPLYALKDVDYEEDFEGSGLGWIKDTSSVNTWKHGVPDYVTNNPLSTNNAWFTDTLKTGLTNYSVESPCFDFREVVRPMISIDMNRKMDDGRDGAVLQYREGNNYVWENIGGTEFGIEWYDNSNITGRPGESVVGWSPEIMDDDFVQARQYMDDLIGLTDVKLRIAYGSDGSAQNSRGLAFDNVRITERTRNVLVEHFTNYNEPATGIDGIREADSIVNVILDNVTGDAMNIQYHTNYYPDDRLYLDNTAVPSARMLFYGLTRNPIAIYDGGWNPDEFAKKYRFDGDNAKENDLRNESMVDPCFNIRVDTLPSHQFEVTIKPLENIDAENMTLFIAIVAKEINSLTGIDGQTSFKNVLRTMIPDAGGFSLKKVWDMSEGETVMGPYDRSVPFIYDSDDIEVIAFLQNNITREVYQAASSGAFKANVTSIGRVRFEEAQFSVYPNPASSNLTLRFDKEITGVSDLIIYNNTGVVVRQERLDPGSDRLFIDDLNLPDGIYIIRVNIDGKPAGFSKLIVAGR